MPTLTIFFGRLCYIDHDIDAVISVFNFFSCRSILISFDISNICKNVLKHKNCNTLCRLLCKIYQKQSGHGVLLWQYLLMHVVQKLIYSLLTECHSTNQINFSHVAAFHEFLITIKFRVKFTMCQWWNYVHKIVGEKNRYCFVWMMNESNNWSHLTCIINLLWYNSTCFRVVLHRITKQ